MAEPAVTRAEQRPSVEQVFRALADATRVRILHLLREGALCVGDLVAALDVPQPTASRHLAYLRKSGLVIDERRGQWSFYRLAAADSEFHAKVLEALQAGESKRTRADAAALRALRRAGGCCPEHARRQRRSHGR